MRKLFTTRRRIAVVGGVTAAVLAVGGVAFAYFTSTGSGTGQATVGSGQANTWGVAQTGVTGTMYPGSGETDVTFTVTNNGTGNQAFTTDSVSIPTSGSDVTSHGADVLNCLQSWFHAAIKTDNAKGVDLAPGGSATVVVAVTMDDANTSQNACEGATPDVTLSVGP